MSWTQHQTVLRKLSASGAIPAYRPVKESSVKDRVIGCASNNDHPLGFTIASVATIGDSVTVVAAGVVKAVAGASLGAGTPVGVASTNGALGPVVAASGSVRFEHGLSQNAAIAGDTFSVLLTRRQISGTP